MSYNYYQLAVQSWCSSSNLIHGLWPDLNRTSYPAFCVGPEFDIEQLRRSPMYSDIETYWYDCTEEQTIALYEHEWTKHGTCVSESTGFTQNMYFEKALALFLENPLGGCYDLNFESIVCP
jgi:ribonuclease I